MGDAYMDTGGRATQDAKTEGQGEGEIDFEIGSSKTVH